MKPSLIVLIALLSVVVGTVIGVGTSLREFTHERGVEAVAPTGGDDATTTMPASGQPRVIVLGEADFDFGVMERNETRTHTFQLKNVGNVPAIVKEGETTCKCTLSELSQGVIQPDEVVEVTLEWKPNSFADSFRQSANIETDDPANPLIRLEVHGRVIQSVRPIPEEIVLSNVSSNESRSAVVYVYCFRPGEFELNYDGAEHAEQEEFYAVDIGPLSQQLIDEQPAAQSGAKITVTVGPGLPLGPINQTLHFSSNVEELPKISIPIRGTVTGDISIVSSRSLYNSDLRLVTIGGVPRDKGGVYRLQLLVKGPYADQTQLSIGEVNPDDVLDVAIDTDNPTKINNGAVLLYPLTITIPPGARPISRLGGGNAPGPKFGKIVIETTHPQDKQVVLLVKFAVEG